jgi:hypothetical protein
MSRINLHHLPQQMSITTTQMTPDTIKISSGAPTGNEIKTAIKHLKSNKASGLDNLPLEIFKNYSRTIANILETFVKKKCGILAKSQANGNKGSS